MDLVSLLGELQSKLIDANVAAVELADVKYKEGFDAGVASVPVAAPAPTDGEAAPVVEPSEEVTKLKEQVAQLEADKVALGDKISAFDASLADLEGFEVAKIEELREKLK